MQVVTVFGELITEALVAPVFLELMILMAYPTLEPTWMEMYTLLATQLAQQGLPLTRLTPFKHMCLLVH